MFDFVRKGGGRKKNEWRLACHYVVLLEQKFMPFAKTYGEVYEQNGSERKARGEGKRRIRQ